MAQFKLNLSIIKSFIADQRAAKRLVSENLGIPIDIPALSWASRIAETRRAYDAAPFADVFRPHGVGLEIRIGDLYIDYDYSITGRADGFDAWRVFVYITAGNFDNRGNDIHLSNQVDNWIKTLELTGRIQKLDNLYYFASGDTDKA